LAFLDIIAAMAATTGLRAAMGDFTSSSGAAQVSSEPEFVQPQ
jgi:hypothetical protein